MNMFKMTKVALAMALLGTAATGFAESASAQPAVQMGATGNSTYNTDASTTDIAGTAMGAGAAGTQSNSGIGATGTNEAVGSTGTAGTIGGPRDSAIESTVGAAGTRGGTGRSDDIGTTGATGMAGTETTGTTDGANVTGTAGSINTTGGADVGRTTGSVGAAETGAADIGGVDDRTEGPRMGGTYQAVTGGDPVSDVNTSIDNDIGEEDRAESNLSETGSDL